MSDEELIAAFENCTLRAEDFHHADHVRMAFLYLSRFPVLEAVQRFSEALRRFAAASGKPGLYHETITWAFLFLMHERMVRASEYTGRRTGWGEFAAANADLLDWKSNILRRYYPDEILSSDFARKIFVLPDRDLLNRTGTD